MPELFNPNLPGQVFRCAEEHVKAWRKSGWRVWEHLTGEEQAAHVAALPEDDDEPAGPTSAASPVSASLDLSPTSDDTTPPESTETPGNGDTPKE